MSYTESILTEDFANKFNECIIPDSSNKQLEFDDKDTFNVERKYQEILKKHRSKSSNYQQNSPQYQNNYRHLDDPNTVLDDYSREIKHKKNEIQMDLGRERRRNRSTSPEIRRTDFIDHSEPRETLERKVVELDHLTSSVRQATSEHHQLCKELQEMQNKLRKNQAEVRLSERMAMDNKERIEDIKKELKEAENRRDQTLRHLELVNEELALKRAKLSSFDRQMTRQMDNIRRMDQYGVDKEEIEKILAERDELYHIVKRQEDVQFEKYELSKQLDMMRDDLYSEQERAFRQIENLEDELECSLKKIKQLQFEKEEILAQFDHLQEHLCSAENQACKSAREVSELRDDYQIRIKKKLEEYEIDKVRVEKELRKLEDEKYMDEANLKSHIETLKKELLITEKERKELREFVFELEENLRKSVQSRSQVLAENEFKIRKLQNEKEEALKNQKKDFLNEQKLLLEEKDMQHGRERNQIQRQCNEEIDRLINDLQMKDREICDYRHRMNAAETDFNCQLQRKQMHFEKLLQSEKSNINEIQNKKKYNEINKIREENDLAKNALTSHIDQLASTLKDRDNEISLLKQELCTARSNHQKIINENVLAVRKLKENVKQETTKELKARYQEKMDKELIKLKAEFEKKLTSKMSTILKEKTAVEESEKRNKFFLNKVAKIVVHEINGECSKMASLLNILPRKVNISKVTLDFSKADNIITQAVANLEACGSEIRNLFEELEAKIKSLSERISSDELKFEREVQNTRCLLNCEKVREVAKIRENLVKEHLKEINRLAKSPDIGLENLLRDKEREISQLLTDRQVWKEEAAKKLADKFDDLNQKKIKELRNLLLKKEAEIRQLKAIRRRSNSPISRNKRIYSTLALEKNDSNLSSLPAEVISSLKDNLETLRLENKNLRHKISDFESPGRKSRLQNEIRCSSKSRER